MQHILSSDQFETGQLYELFEQADEFKEYDFTLEGRKEVRQYHAGRIIVSMFYEPSTRTRLSFDIAAQKLGIGVVDTENAEEFSSAVKGEQIQDTVRVLSGYGIDGIVLRTKDEGQAAKAAEFSTVPIINGGDGKGEHPTQAALDAYTIFSEIGRLDDISVVLGGDLLHGRTARSLANLLAKYERNQLYFISPPELRMGSDILDYLRTREIPFVETDDMHEVLPLADVVYWTRPQLERHAGTFTYDKGRYALGPDALARMREDTIIMHPLPRTEEIPFSTDADPRAKYFVQAHNGMYMRMAMLDAAMSGLPG